MFCRPRQHSPGVFAFRCSGWLGAAVLALLMTFLAVSPESRAQFSDDTRAGARDFGDITSFTGPRFPRGRLDGEGDQVDYYRFTLAEAKRVVLGLRQQDADADMFLEDSDGNELYGSTASGRTTR